MIFGLKFNNQKMAFYHNAVLNCVIVDKNLTIFLEIKHDHVWTFKAAQIIPSKRQSNLDYQTLDL